MLSRILILLVLSLSTAIADEILVITGHESIAENMSLKKLENIFLKKVQVNDSGTRWIPLNLNPDNPVRIAFSESLFKQHPEELETYWNEQYFQGIEPPHVLTSEEAMLRFVSSTKGSIGYILPCHLDGRVQVIFRLKISITQNCNPAAN